jgi:hypothetical protein
MSLLVKTNTTLTFYCPACSLLLCFIEANKNVAFSRLPPSCPMCDYPIAQEVLSELLDFIEICYK